jgi:hypothetical protein
MAGDGSDPLRIKTGAGAAVLSVSPQQVQSHWP